MAELHILKIQKQSKLIAILSFNPDLSSLANKLLLIIKVK